MSLNEPEFKESVATEIQEEVTEPPMYKVLLHNDDYTTMEFVVEVLMRIFNKPLEQATQIMLNVHKKGVGLCGIYTYELAETKVNQVDASARERGFPLKTTMERE